MTMRTACVWSVFLLTSTAPAADRPNILWLTSEDHGPHLGCYGDAYAVTPNADRLAAKGMIYTRVWSNAPVCAPARTALISGLYPTSTGSEHMRSLVPFPAGKEMFPQFLRAAGYHCTNNSKEDYNLATPGKVWDESSRAAHWRTRKSDQPFFAVFNSEKSHESKIRVRPHTAVHNPARVRVPAYHPDTPEVRRDWAQYYDCVTDADADAGVRLKELDAEGLADDTIVFFFADHGPGLPRCKRSPYNSGLHVPLVVYVPEKWRAWAGAEYKPRGSFDRVIGFVDFAPTVLSLAGLAPPEWMQGRAFLGRFAAPAQVYAFGFRGRMDERYDLVRSATDGRYVYVRNYMPHLPHGQHLDYMFQTPTTRVWKELYDAGRLTAAQGRFWGPKPPEELYDLRSDPDETTDLAGDPAHRAVLERLRTAQQDLARSTRDVGFLPEGDRFARAAGQSQYDLARDGDRYPFDRVFGAAELAAGSDPGAAEKLAAALGDSDSAVRYWAALGLQIRGRVACADAAPALRAALRDRSPAVRVAAAEALGRYGSDADLKIAEKTLVDSSNGKVNDVFTVMAALNGVGAVRHRCPDAVAAVKALPPVGDLPDRRYASYVPQLLAELSRTGK